MPRARTKQELLDFGSERYKSLLEIVKELSEDKITKEYVFDNRSIKDIFAHLHAWQILTLGWYEVGMKGEKPEIPYPGYSFKDAPALNEKLFQDYKDMSWEEVLKNLNKTHDQCMKVIKNHTDEELTEKKKYKWTGSTNMASYMASATSSHYEWGYQLIKKFLKNS